MPCWIEAFVLMLLSPLFKYSAIKRAIQASNADTIILRLTTEFLWIPKIKRDFPELTLCIEINAIVIDEYWSGMWLKKPWRRIYAKCLKSADCITVVSEQLKKSWCVQGLNPEKILVNHNGVNPEVFRPLPDLDRHKLRERFGIPDNAFVLGYVGGMQPFRRLPEVIEKFAQMRRDGEKDIFVLMVGDGTDMSSIKAAVSRNKGILNGCVKLTGQRAYEEIPAIMQIFDLAIFPFSNPYGSPIKLFEYLAMGIPTIGPDVPVVREVFQDGKHLRLINQARDGFIATVRELRNSQTKREELARTGKDHVLKFYTWQANAKRVCQHISILKCVS